MTFEVGDHSDPQSILLGRYRIDVRHNVIIDTRKAR